MEVLEEPLRPTGLMEQYNIVRNHLKFYNNVAMTAVYNTPRASLSSPDEAGITALIAAVLEQIVHRKPIMGVVIEDEAVKNPQWKRIQQFYVKDVVHVSMSVVDTDLDTMRTIAHRRMLDRVNELPLWRIIVTCRKQSVQSEQADHFVLNVGFFYHHAIGDGMSGAAFHLAFLDALNSIDLTLSPPGPDHIIKIAPNALPPTLELSTSLPISWRFMLKLLFKQFVYDPPNNLAWTGPQIPADPKPLPISNNIRSLTYTNNQLNSILHHCKAQKISLTALLTLLISTHLSRTHTSFTHFNASIPFSTRKFSSGTISTTDMGCFVSQAVLTFSSATSHPPSLPLSSSSSSEIYCPAMSNHDFSASFWDSCRKTKLELDRQTATVQDQGIGMLRYIANDFAGYYRGKLGRTREAAFEVSNIGVVDGGFRGDENDEGSEHDLPRGLKKSKQENPRAWFEKIQFSASSSPYAPPFVFCVSSARAGELYICLVTEQGVVAEEHVDGLLGYLDASLLHLAGV